MAISIFNVKNMIYTLSSINMFIFPAFAMVQDILLSFFLLLNYAQNLIQMVQMCYSINT